jgi:hypothetical protein
VLVAEEVNIPQPVVETPEARPTQALSGWEALRRAIDHVLVADLLRVERLLDDTRRVLRAGH